MAARQRGADPHRPPRARLAREFELTLVTFADGPRDDGTHGTRADLEALLPKAQIELVPFEPAARTRPAGRDRERCVGDVGSLRRRRRCAALSSAGSPRPTAGCSCTSTAPASPSPGSGSRPERTVYSAHNVEHRSGAACSRDARRRSGRTSRSSRARSRSRSGGVGACRRLPRRVRGRRQRDARRRRAPRGAARPQRRRSRASRCRRTTRPARTSRCGCCSSATAPTGPTSTASPGLRQRGAPEGAATAAGRAGVVGPPPAGPVAAAGITYHGRVDALEPFYDAAHAAIVPMFEGSGTRLKVIEASFLGRPVISTALGAQGLPLRPGARVRAGRHGRASGSPRSTACAPARWRRCPSGRGQRSRT